MWTSTNMRYAILRTLGIIAIAAPALAAQPPRLRVKFPAFPVEIALDTLVFARERIDAPAGETFAAVRAVYTDLKIPRDVADSTNRQMGAFRFTRSYTLGNERLSVYFNCGSGLTGANADSWRVTIAIASYVQRSAEGKTTLGTGVVAQAQDMGGVSKEPVTCGSTGLLESRIVDLVKRRLAPGS